MQRVVSDRSHGPGDCRSLYVFIHGAILAPFLLRRKLGDYHGVIPLPDNVKAGSDVVVIPPVIAAGFDWITIPNMAALAGLIYTLLRIYDWWCERQEKKRK